MFSLVRSFILAWAVCVSVKAQVLSGVILDRLGLTVPGASVRLRALGGAGASRP